MHASSAGAKTRVTERDRQGNKGYNSKVQEVLHLKIAIFLHFGDFPAKAGRVLPGRSGTAAVSLRGQGEQQQGEGEGDEVNEQLVKS